MIECPTYHIVATTKQKLLLVNFLAIVCEFYNMLAVIIEILLKIVTS